MLTYPIDRSITSPLPDAVRMRMIAPLRARRKHVLASALCRYRICFRLCRRDPMLRPGCAPQSAAKQPPVASGFRYRRTDAPGEDLRVQQPAVLSGPELAQEK